MENQNIQPASPADYGTQGSQVSKNVHFAEAFCVAFNPKGSGLLNGDYVDQAILGIDGQNLFFEDIRARSFRVPLTQATYSVTPNHRLRIAIQNDTWEFQGFQDNTRINTSLKPLIDKYKLNPNQTGGAYSLGSALKSMAPLAGGAAVGTEGGIVGAAGVFYAAAQMNKMHIESEKYIDSFVNQLSQAGVTVSQLAPGKFEKYTDSHTTLKSQFHFMILIFKILGFALLALVVLFIVIIIIGTISHMK